MAAKTSSVKPDVDEKEPSKEVKKLKPTKDASFTPIKGQLREETISELLILDYFASHFYPTMSQQLQQQRQRQMMITLTIRRKHHTA